MNYCLVTKVPLVLFLIAIGPETVQLGSNEQQAFHQLVGTDDLCKTWGRSQVVQMPFVESIDPFIQCEGDKISREDFVVMW